MPRPRSPEEEFIHGEESKGPHAYHDPTHSPYEGDIPPWGQAGYEGEFPLEGKVFYVNAYTLIEFKTRFQTNLRKYGQTHAVGVFPTHLQMGADFDYVPFAGIPVRMEDRERKDFFFRYLERLSKRAKLPFLRIVIEPDFPQGQPTESGPVRGTVTFPDGRYITYSMDTPFKHPLVQYVNAYTVNRLYGGPEEGGWWYDAGRPVAAVPYLANGEYTAGKLESYLQNTVGWHSQYPLSSVLGRDEFRIHHEDSFPVEYPQVPPHYE